MRNFLAFAANCVWRLIVVLAQLVNMIIVARVFLRKRHIDELKVAFVLMMDGISAFLLQSLVLSLLLDNVLILF